MIVLSKI